MNIQQEKITKIKDKIRQLMNKSNQLDGAINMASPSQSKENLKKEKLANNDELRKARTEKYDLEQIQENIDYIKKSYMFLKKLGILKSQYEFSSQFLNRTAHYYSMIICENRKPSISSVNSLVKNLIEMKNLYEDLDKNTEARYLEQIINKGQQLITKRLLEYW